MAGAKLHTGQPVLDFEFGEPESRERLGTSPRIEVVSCSVPSPSKLPKYGTTADGSYWAAALSMENTNFIRDTAMYLRETTFVRPIAVAIDNISTSLAEDIVIRIRIEGNGAAVRTKGDMPDLPSTDRTIALVGRRAVATNTAVKVFDDHSEIVIRLGNVQPGTTVWSTDPFFIGARTSGRLQAIVKISANNLRIPKMLDTHFEIQVEQRSLTVSDIRDLAMKME
jgi:hypothetical protein